MNKLRLMESWFLKANYLEFTAVLTLANIGMYFGTWLIIVFLRKYFIRYDLNLHEASMSQDDFITSLIVLFLNILVGVVGLWFLKQGYISFNPKKLVGIFLDFILMLLFMDFCMYVLHIIAHHKLLYKKLHGLHHTHEDMAPLSLYVMHPLEAFGFGLIMIFFLCLYSIDIAALILFLIFNWLFGVFAHSGIEPNRGELGNYICMTRFHQLHHQHHNCNYGFFTPIWDVLFRTRKYDRE